MWVPTPKVGEGASAATGDAVRMLRLDAAPVLIMGGKEFKAFGENARCCSFSGCWFFVGWLGPFPSFSCTDKSSMAWARTSPPTPDGFVGIPSSRVVVISATKSFSVVMVVWQDTVSFTRLRDKMKMKRTPLSFAPLGFVDVFAVVFGSTDLSKSYNMFDVENLEPPKSLLFVELVVFEWSFPSFVLVATNTLVNNIKNPPSLAAGKIAAKNGCRGP